jgi:putative heme iron utilization protein
MEKAPIDPRAGHADAVADAKRLMRVSRTAALATLDPETGSPLSTLVGVASDFDGTPLHLLSTLARHTRRLAADPRVSVLLSEQAERGDPLNHPRVSLNGRIERATEPRVRTRYLQRNPKAKLYVDFADFAFFRLTIESVHFNGGFGRADVLTPADILITRVSEAVLTEAEPHLVAWVNKLGDDEVARLAGRKRAGRRLWRAIGLDAEGLDLAAGGEAARLQFLRLAHDEADWRGMVEAALER